MLDNDLFDINSWWNEWISWFFDEKNFSYKSSGECKEEKGKYMKGRGEGEQQPQNVFIFIAEN